MTATAPSPSVLLRVDASPRLQPSVSRRIADAFEASWLQGQRDARVVHRDLALQAVPHLQAQTVVGFYTPTEALDDDLRRALVVSDTLIAELQAADTLLISTPMYNFTVPSVLKAWIDQVARINSTFAYDGTGFSGLVRTRRAVVIAAHGLGGYSGYLAGVDFLRSAAMRRVRPDRHWRGHDHHRREHLCSARDRGARRRRRNRGRPSRSGGLR